MISADSCFQGALGPSDDAQSAVYLLDADTTDELHNVPLDTDQSLGPEGSAPDCVVHNIPNKETPVIERHYPDHQFNQCIVYIWTSVFAFASFVVLAHLVMLFYMLYLHEHQSTVLQDLTQRLDCQSRILQQMAANQHLAGYNPGQL